MYISWDILYIFFPWLHPHQGEAHQRNNLATPISAFKLHHTWPTNDLTKVYPREPHDLEKFTIGSHGEHQNLCLKKIANILRTTLQQEFCLKKLDVIQFIYHLSLLFHWKGSTTCVVSVWRNNINCRYIFMFLLKHFACKGLTHWPLGNLNEILDM